MKLISSILIICFVVFGKISFGQIEKNFSRDNPLVVLIPGGASSGGQVYLSSLTPLARYTGHGDYFKSYRKLLNELNLPYILCLQEEDDDKRSLIERSRECIYRVSSKIRSNGYKSRNLILLGHSVGGNIARLVAQDILVGNFVHSVLTISTPHKGTILADFAYDQYLEGEGFRSETYKKIMELIGFIPEKKSYFKEMFVERRWDDPLIFLSQDIEDNPNVSYYSISNYLKKGRPSLISLTESIIRSELQKRGLDQTPYGDLSDGIVPTYSMVYGRHVANIPADHIEGLCIGIFNLTSGCKAMKRSIKSIIKMLKEKIRID